MNLNHVTIIASDLERSVRFYKSLGLLALVHEPPSYARFSLPHGRSTLSVLVTDEARPMGKEQTRLFFECADLDERCERLAASGVSFAQRPAITPYGWREAHLRDPDGHDIRLYLGPDRLLPGATLANFESSRPRSETTLEPYAGPRQKIRSLFELADDSSLAIDSYFEKGTVIVAKMNGDIVGHVQLIDDQAGEQIEIKSIAVIPVRTGRGIGSKLMDAALRHGQSMKARRIKVSTSIAAFDSLRFYLRRGYRACRIARDAFTPAQGYAEGADLGGIPLNDAIELEMLLPRIPASAERG